MKQLQQEQQFKQVPSNQKPRNKQKYTLQIHNPNTKEQTAKYLADLILEGLEGKAYGEKI